MHACSSIMRSGSLEEKYSADLRVMLTALLHWVPVHGSSLWDPDRVLLICGKRFVQIIEPIGKKKRWLFVYSLSKSNAKEKN